MGCPTSVRGSCDVAAKSALQGMLSAQEGLKRYRRYLQSHSCGFRSNLSCQRSVPEVAKPGAQPPRYTAGAMGAGKSHVVRWLCPPWNSMSYLSRRPQTASCSAKVSQRLLCTPHLCSSVANQFSEGFQGELNVAALPVWGFPSNSYWRSRLLRLCHAPLRPGLV